ncbi:hypothetical protein GCM10017691_49270 [Pseudonocardia petroleophila]
MEPIHAVTYFAPESKAACDALGTRGYWMSYFGLRAAPLGAAPPELVTALFYNFHPAHVARAVPDVWAVAPPERYLEARLEAVDAALRRLVGPEVLAGPEVAEAASIARAAALAAPTAGRALAAANAALPWPDAPHLVLWQAQTVLREHRGDGHVAALLTAGLDPLEALVVFAADLGLDAAALRLRRGWSEQEWDAAVGRLAERGLLDAAGALDEEGRLLRAEVEAHTDALADVPWLAVGAERAERLVELAAPLVAALAAGDGFAPDNPMGLRLLPAAG